MIVLQWADHKCKYLSLVRIKNQSKIIQVSKWTALLYYIAYRYFCELEENSSFYLVLRFAVFLAGKKFYKKLYSYWVSFWPCIISNPKIRTSLSAWIVCLHVCFFFSILACDLSMIFCSNSSFNRCKKLAVLWVFFLICPK